MANTSASSKPVTLTDRNLWILHSKSRRGFSLDMIVAETQQQAEAVGRKWCEQQTGRDTIGRGVTFLKVTPAVIATQMLLEQNAQPESNDAVTVGV